MTLKRPPWRDTHGSYTFSAVKFKDFSRTTFLNFNLLLLTEVPNKL